MAVMTYAAAAAAALQSAMQADPSIVALGALPLPVMVRSDGTGFTHQHAVPGRSAGRRARPRSFDDHRTTDRIGL